MRIGEIRGSHKQLHGVPDHVTTAQGGENMAANNNRKIYMHLEFVLDDQNRYIVLKSDKNDGLHQRFQKIVCYNVHLLRKTTNI